MFPYLAYNPLHKSVILTQSRTPLPLYPQHWFGGQYVLQSTVNKRLALNSLNAEDTPAIARCTHTSWRTWDAAVIRVSSRACSIDDGDDGESNECVEKLHVESLECVGLLNYRPATYGFYTIPQRPKYPSRPELWHFAAAGLALWLMMPRALMDRIRSRETVRQRVLASRPNS